MVRAALDVLPLVGPRSGVGEFVWQLLRALPGAGVEPTGWGITWRGRARIREAVPRGLEVLAWPVPARPAWLAWRALGRPRVDRLFAGVDVVHATNFTLPPLAHTPTIVTVHDLTVVHHPEWCEAATRTYPALVARAVREGALVHTPTRAVAEEVRDWLGLASDRVVAIAHGAPVPTPPPSTVPPRLARLRGRRWLLALGTLEPRKGIDELIAAFGLLHEVEADVGLVLAGRWGWGVDAIAERLATSPARAHIVVTGYVDPPERAWLLANAAVLAYPSRYEGFGLPPLEAMAQGVPVVASDVPALREVLGEAALFAPVGDAAALATALVRALREGATRAEAGRARAGEYTWERTARAMRELYERAAS